MAFTISRSNEAMKHGGTNKNLNNSEARGVPSVSKQNNNDLKLNPHDLYPSMLSQNPSNSIINKNQILHQSSSSLTSSASNMDTNKNHVHKMSDSRYGSGFNSKTSRSPYSQMYSNTNMDDNALYRHSNYPQNTRRPSLKQSFNNASIVSGDMSQSRLTAADNNAASIYYARNGPNCTNGAGANIGAGTTTGTRDDHDGPLRLQYRGHSVRSTRSTKSEGPNPRTRDNNNFIYYPQTPQGNQNQFNVSMLQL